MAREGKVSERMDDRRKMEPRRLGAVGLRVAGRRWRAVAARTLPACLAVCFAAACGSGNGGQVRGEANDRAAPGEAASGERTAPPSQAAMLPAPGVAWVVFGTDTVRAEVASTPAAREKGLMDRGSVPDGTGMLFVFPQIEERSFWMKDTHVALDIAFFGASNQVISISRMEPLDETLTDSGGPTSLALEVRQGWFAEQGIEVGAVAEIVFGPGLQIS